MRGVAHAGAGGVGPMTATDLALAFAIGWKVATMTVLRWLGRAEPDPFADAMRRPLEEMRLGTDRIAAQRDALARQLRDDDAERRELEAMHRRRTGYR